MEKENIMITEFNDTGLFALIISDYPLFHSPKDFRRKKANILHIIKTILMAK